MLHLFFTESMLIWFAWTTIAAVIMAAVLE